MRTAFFAACLLVSGNSLAAQLIVDPGSGGGGGSFTSLQTAIDAAAAGDTILVVGGCYRDILIDKPLTIVGTGKIIRTSMSCTGVAGSGLLDACEGVACPALVIGPSAGTVTIAGLTIDGHWDALFADSDAEPTIRCSPTTELRLYDCIVTGPVTIWTKGLAVETSAAIDAVGARLTLVRTTVTGGRHVYDGSQLDSQYWLNLIVQIGPPAIVANEVLLLDSTVVGGSQGEFLFAAGDSQGCPPPWAPGFNPNWSTGGPGIVADRIYQSGGSLSGGAGGSVKNKCAPGPAVPYLQQPSGESYVGPEYHFLQNDLVSSGKLKIGNPWSVTSTGTGGFLVIGVIQSQPLSQGQAGLLFILPPFLPFVPGNGFGTTVPSMPTLIGLQIGVQWVSPIGVLSRPVYEVVQP